MPATDNPTGQAAHFSVTFEGLDGDFDHAAVDTVTPEQAFEQQYAQRLVNVVSDSATNCAIAASS